MDLQKIYKEAAIGQVYNFYSNYKDHYKSISMDLKDLEQEVKIEIFIKLQDPKVSEMEQKDLLKYVNTLTERTLIKFIRKSVKTDSNIVKQGIYAVDKKRKGDPKKIIAFLKEEYNLNDRDYTLLHKRFIENKSYKQIAKELEIESSGVSVVSGRIRRILRKHKWYDFIYNFVFSENQVLEDSQNYSPDDHFNISLVHDLENILNKKQLYVVTERAINNIPEVKIAESLNITQQAVNLIYDKSIKKLRKILNKELYKII